MMAALSCAYGPADEGSLQSPRGDAFGDSAGRVVRARIVLLDSGGTGATDQGIVIGATCFLGSSHGFGVDTTIASGDGDGGETWGVHVVAASDRQKEVHHVEIVARSRASAVASMASIAVADYRWMVDVRQRRRVERHPDRGRPRLLYATSNKAPSFH